MNDAIAKAIADAAAKLNDEFSSFWQIGEVPDAIPNRPINALIHGRIKRVREYLLSNGHPVFEHQLTQLMLWEARSNKPMGTAAAAFKYLLLQEAEKAGETWTKKIDTAAEKLAIEIVENNRALIKTGDK